MGNPQSAWDVARGMYAAGGGRAFFRGFHVTLLRAVPVAASVLTPRGQPDWREWPTARPRPSRPLLTPSICNTLPGVGVRFDGSAEGGLCGSGGLYVKELLVKIQPLQ